MASKEVQKIQQEENGTISLENTGSNLQQRMRVVQEEKVKVNIDQKGKIKSVEMSQKTLMEGPSTSKGSKAGVSLKKTVSRPGIAE